ncbi:hypothetical protein E2C01_040564 [Portunus trituberculatus]|uniref:Uncharacterized protein n=1 Tax=Portunus trituberculatus TaxID=210409 RepID=A0A5B7FP37_PORTR|nr:hypothetical protein [Portunus trituberculatus]
MILEYPLVCLSQSSSIIVTKSCLSFPYSVLTYTLLLGHFFPVYPSRLLIPFPSVFLHREDLLFLPIWWPDHCCIFQSRSYHSGYRAIFIKGA